MLVTKRDGEKHPVSFDKISKRIRDLTYDEHLGRLQCDPMLVAQKTIAGVYDGVSTRELDILSSEIASNMVSQHTDYGVLAGRILISNLHKETKDSFLQITELLANATRNNRPAPMLNQRYLTFVRKNAHLIQNEINYKNDFLYSFAGLKTLQKSYLLHLDGKIVERPQHMLMRVAIAIHCVPPEDSSLVDDMILCNDPEISRLSSAFETYRYMSAHYFTHATPTLFNAGAIYQQLSSCFLLTMKDDSLSGIYKTLDDCAQIAKRAGGIGFSIHNIRAKGSYIVSTGGTSNGLVPMLRVFNSSSCYVDQGGNKRPGSMAAYLEPWHADIRDFLELPRPLGMENLRARDLFYALWVPDLFMKRVQNNEIWSLFCPNEAPGLSDVWGEEFEQLYERYEREGRARSTIPAQKLMEMITTTQIESGRPYILFKDACNRKSNQQNLGTIKSSNLCTEIIEFSSPDETAVCNLASISLPEFVVNGQFDFNKLYDSVCVLTRNLNKVIYVNDYPIESAKRSNFKHRPIGIGCQGMAELFFKLRIAFEDEAGLRLNRDIFETIYFASLSESCKIAERRANQIKNSNLKYPGAYTSFDGSPISKGILQFDMWNVQPSDRWNWVDLRQRISKFGIFNSLLVTQMPTASTAHILGNTEMCEPINSNVYTRKIIAGEFQFINDYLIADLAKLGLWNETMRQKIIKSGGSVQNILEIPEDIKRLYKTVFELKQKLMLDYAISRGPFICQSQSTNYHFTNPNTKLIYQALNYAWSNGLKTGMYYLRSRAASDAVQFSITKKEEEPAQFCTRDNPDCAACSA